MSLFYNNLPIKNIYILLCKYYIMKRDKLLIFDFDGTIADTKSLYYKAICNELKIFNISYKQVDKAIEVGLSLKKTLQKLGFSFITSWFLKKKIMKQVEKQAEKVKKCKDAGSIKQLQADKILISNSLKEMIYPVLKRFNLTCFREIYGAEDFPDKAPFIKDYIKKRKIKKQNCYYIGDKVKDIETARKAGCKSIIIAGKCAWDSKSEILKEKPDFILESIADLRKILNQEK